MKNQLVLILSVILSTVIASVTNANSFIEANVEKTLINIPEVISVHKKEIISLYDVIDIRSVHQEIKSDLAALFKSIVISECKNGVCEKYLTRNDLSTKVRELVSGNQELKNIQFIFPEMLKIESSSDPKIELTRKIKNEALLRCGPCRIDIKMNVNISELKLEPNWDLDFSQFKGRGAFTLPVVSQSVAGGQKWLSGQIRVEQLVPVANRMILQNEKLELGDIKYKFVDTTYAKDKVLSSSEIVGLLAVRTLSVDTPVWKSDLKLEPAIKRGQTVKVLIGNSDFEVTTNCIAEDTGVLGDMVKVKSIESNKILTGTIIDKGIVRVE